MPLKENGLPLMLAKLLLTAKVLAGCTIAHPKQPPIPDVAKITDLGRSDAFAGAASFSADVARREMTLMVAVNFEGNPAVFNYLKMSL
jgi:hypothetical protein